MEVAEYGVRVAVVAPWHIRTTLPQEMLLHKGSPYADAVRRVKANRDHSIATAPGAHLVVDKVMAIIDNPRPPALTVVGRPLFTFLLRHLPARHSWRDFPPAWWVFGVALRKTLARRPAPYHNRQS